MRSTIKDVAKLANVSNATVSLVMNNKGGVNKETRMLVLDAAKKLNYTPSQIARSLSTKKSATIGLVVTNIENPFFGSIVHELNIIASKNNYNLLVEMSNDRVADEKRAIEHLIRNGVEGIILVPTRDGEGNLDHLYNLKNLGIPLVFITSKYLGIKADLVMTDFIKSSYEVTKYLISNGCRKIYFLTDYAELILSQHRIQGYKKAFSDADLEYNNNWIIETSPDFASGNKITYEILKHEVPDAIIAVNDILAIGVMKCLKDRNIRIPDQVQVVGFDNIIYSTILFTTLSSVNQPIHEMCENAFKIIMERIQGNEESLQEMYLPADFIIRESIKKKERLV